MDDPKNQKTIVNHLKKKKRKRKKQIDLNEIEGLQRVVLSEPTQEIIGVVVGKDVTFEKPWVHIDKSILLNSNITEIADIEEVLKEIPRDDILLVYIPDDDRDYDEYYVAVTESATDHVTILLNKQKEEQDRRLYNSIHKSARPWYSLGSEKEVEEEILRQNRPLIEVELECKYPLRYSKREFRCQYAEDVKHGYLELGTGIDDELEIIPRRRTDVGIQVTQEVACNEAQTLLLYPANAATQYQYEIDPNRVHPPEILEKIGSYIQENEAQMEDLLQVNYFFNLYTNDYKTLVTKKEATATSKNSIKDAVEHRSFFSIDRCKDKMISSLAWHTQWRSIIVSAYCDISKAVYQKLTETQYGAERAVCGSNPVVAWSLADSLKPKLMMQVHREITVLSFCPYEENILLGGCSNGQVILWDLTNQLDRVDKEERALTSNFTYRKYIFSLLGWMENMVTSSYISTTAISDLHYSHTSSIICIVWLPLNRRITNTGKTILLRDDAGSEDIKSTVPQFITASEDGTICAWDLEKSADESKSEQQNVKRRPTGLQGYVSPFKHLHLNLKPTFRINLFDVPESTIFTPIYAFCCSTKSQASKDSEDAKEEKVKVDEFGFPSEETEEEEHTEFVIGTVKGEVARLTWESLELDAEEIPNSQVAQINEHSMYHDGPVTALLQCSNSDIILTTGGRIFALWMAELKNKPVYWRKRNAPITFGCFNEFQASSIMILTLDGYVEIWDIYSNSKYPQVIERLSNNPLTELVFQSQSNGDTLTGVADAYGCLRVYLNSRSQYDTPNDNSALEAFIERETKFKNQFLKWQTDWNKKYNPKPAMNIIIATKKLTTRRDKIDNLLASKLTKVKLQRSQEQLLKQAKLEESKKEIDQKQEMKAMIMTKKNFDEDDLLKQRSPLKILEEEHQKKKKKMKTTQRASEKIYSDVMLSSFPDIVAEKPKLQPNPYAGGYSQEAKSCCYDNYRKCEDKARQTMRAHPFEFKYSMRDALINCRRRRE